MELSKDELEKLISSLKAANKVLQNEAHALVCMTLSYIYNVDAVFPLKVRIRPSLINIPKSYIKTV